MKNRKWKEGTLLLKAVRSGRQTAAEQFRVTGTKYKEQAALIKDVLQAQANSAEQTTSTSRHSLLTAAPLRTCVER